MPKNPTTEILRRLRNMDSRLGSGGGGLIVPQFARKWGVSPRTVRRDLDALKALGQKLECEVQDICDPRGVHRDTHCWRYGRGVVQLFTLRPPPPKPPAG